MTYTINDIATSKELTATDEQIDIIDFVLANPSTNLLINALAGAAKTSTLRFLCKYLPIEPTLSLAFNKRIADEMAKVLPGHVRCATMNSVGHRVWAAAIGKRLVVEAKHPNKTYKIVKEMVDALPRRDRQDAYEIFSDITKAISRAKLAGYIPAGAPAGRSLLTEEEFFGGLEETPDEWFIMLVNKALLQGILQSYQGLIDFDDQIYMPTLFGGSFPQHRRVMGDESQDFSPLNHEMLKKLVGPSTQLIAVGDPWQSIYAFRGADTASMGKLRDEFKMHEMTLSVSFRCPIAVVMNARQRVPHMKWPEWAKPGTVQIIEEWDAASIPDRAAIICRNNAPLMSIAYRLLQAERGVQVVGTDLGPSLVKILKKLGDPSMKQEEVLNAIDIWEQTKLSKARDAGTITDKAECLRVFAKFGSSLGGAIAYCEHIFSQKGTIQLLSGHKAKGLEWDTVYHLDPHRIPSPWAKDPESLQQELNVRYVIETRAKEALYFVKMEGFIGD